MRYSLLYVEDDRDLAELNINYLSDAGFTVIYAQSGESALNKIQQYHPDIILLDIMMPGMDGYEVAKTVRKKNNIPILFLTSLSDKDNAIKGLNTGANDYIRKDVHIEEIVARLYNALKTTRKDSKIVQITDNTYLNSETYEVVSHEHRTKLSFREYDLLHFLVVNANTIHTREYIISNIWRDMINGDIYLRKSLSLIRKSISRDKNVSIKTFRGSGVMFVI